MLLYHPGMRIRVKQFGGVAAVLVAGAGAWFYFRPSAPAQAPVAPQAVAPVPEPDEVRLAGKIRAQYVIDVAAPQDGMITALFADNGQEVYEGQLLARITSEGLEASREAAVRALEGAQNRLNTIESAVLAGRLEASRARAAASRARSDFDRLERIHSRQQMLLREGAVARQNAERTAREFEMAQSEYQALDDVATRAEERVSNMLKDLDAARRVVEEKNAELEDIKARLAASELVSPVTGLVVGRNGSMGEQVTAERRDFFQIAVNLSQLEVVLEPEPPILKLIGAGQPALVMTAEQAGEGLEGSVKGIDGTLVIVRFVSPNPAIKPGMTAQVRVRLK